MYYLLGNENNNMICLSMCTTVNAYIHLIPRALGWALLLLCLQMQKIEVQDDKQLAQAHTAIKNRQGLNLGSLAS